MTGDQEALLRDKLAVWRNVADFGLVDFRDYNRRAVDALEALFDRAESAESELSSLKERADRLAEALKVAAQLAEQIQHGNATPQGGAKLIADHSRAALASYSTPKTGENNG